MEQFEKHIMFSNTAIELAKNSELRDLFIDLALRKDFVDPIYWCDEPHLKGTQWGAKALVYFFESIERNCSGLIEFQKRKGVLSLFGFPKIRLTNEGKQMAEMLLASKKKMEGDD